MIGLSIAAFKQVRHIRVVPHQQRNQVRTMTKKDFQLLRCLFTQDVVFIAFSLWINIYYVYAAVTKDQIRTAKERAIVNFVNNLCVCLYNIPFYVSFLIFVIVSRAFRQELKRIFYKICRENIVVPRKEENKPDVIAINSAVK
jgi:hypothetical protein